MSSAFLEEMRNTFVAAVADKTLLCNMFDNIECSISIYEVCDNTQFTLIALNKYASENETIFRGNPIGKRLHDIYRGLSFISINSAFIRAWRSKKCEKLTFFLDDSNKNGWRHCLILPISTGRILNILDDMPDIAKLLKELYEQEKRLRDTEEKARLSKEKIQNFLAYMQNTIEEERARIARDIHDDLGQKLTAIKMSLVYLMKEEKIINESRNKVQEILDMIGDIIESVKRISYEMRPSILDHLGLIPTIEWQTEEFQRYTGIQCEVDIAIDNEQIDRNIAISLFRIFQEAMSNIANHSKATWVYINMYSGGDYIEFSIIDNGIGINEAEISDPESYGIIGIHERVRALNGEMDIRGIEGRGTTLKIRIPVITNNQERK